MSKFRFFGILWGRGGGGGGRISIMPNSHFSDKENVNYDSKESPVCWHQVQPLYKMYDFQIGAKSFPG